MKKLPFVAITALCSALLLSSREKELDFKYHYADPIPVIEAKLTQEGMTVVITETTPMGEPMNTTRIVDAEVYLEDKTESAVYSLSADREGLFRADVCGIPHHEYRLTVTMKGQSYVSDCTMSESVGNLELKFNWIRMPYDDVAILQASFDDPETDGDRYWLRVYRDGEPYRWSVIPDMIATGGRISEVMFTTRKNLEEEDEDDILVDGSIVTASVVKIDKTMSEYLEALIQGGSNGPKMFEGPSCLGYFIAAPVTEATIVFHPDEISYWNQTM